MKNKIIRKMTLGGVFAVVFLLSACSDGILPKSKVDVPEPEISAGAESVGSNDEPSESVSLNTAKGEESTTLEVQSGADVYVGFKIMNITSGEFSSIPPEVLDGKTYPLIISKEKIIDKDGNEQEINVSKGGRTFNNISSGFTIVIVARNEIEHEGEKVSSDDVKIEIIIKVIPPLPALTINKFTAEPAEINEGEMTNVCWNVTPTDAVVEVKDQDGKNILEYITSIVIDDETPLENGELSVKGFAKEVAEEEEDDELADEDGAVPATPNPEKCYTVTLQKDTDFTLTAKTADDQEDTAKVSIKVNPIELKIVSLTANGIAGSVNLEKSSDVKLAWEVTPENATVTIDNDIGKISAKGEKLVKVERTTVFKLTASYKDKTEGREVVVNVLENGDDGPKVGAFITLSINTADIFAGEEVKFSWDAVEISSEAEISLVGPEGTTKAKVKDGGINVKPTVSGAYTAEISVGNSVVRSNQVDIAVRKWKAEEVSGTWLSADISDNGQLALFGKRGSDRPEAKDLEKDDDMKEEISIGREVGNTFNEIVVDFGGAFRKLYIIKNTTYDVLAGYRPFGFNAFATDSESGRIYGGGVGGLFFSDDKGKNWGLVDPFILDNSDSEKSSCKGAKQVGDKTGKNTFQNLSQVCSVLVDGSRLLAATDNGVYYLDNVDAHMKDRYDTSLCWQGVADKKCSKTNELSGVVVHTLESYGGKIFAGTAKGLYSSDNRGESWSAANGGAVGDGTAIYAIAVSADGKVLYVGGSDGVFTAQLGTSDFAKAGELGGKVYSLAVDTTNGNVYAGTDAGVTVSRDNGKTWVNVTESMGAVPTVYGLAIAKRTGEVAIYAATSGGVYSSVAPAYVNNAKEEPAPEPEPETPAPAPSATDALKLMTN